jgi:small subunit ribosomal protein S13
MALENRQFKYIVRIAGTDIDGKLKLTYGLAEIKGIGYTTALAIARILGLDPDMRIGFLTEEEIRKIEEAVKDITRLGLPAWLYNRRKDYETGIDKHLIGPDLIFHARRDIEREIRIGSWRGVRHKLGLKVRGQRTATTGRLGMTVGVRKKR